MMAAHFKGALDAGERSRSFPRGPRLCSERGVAAGIGVSMDDRKWIAIMVASMLLLVGVAGAATGASRDRTFSGERPSFRLLKR